MNLHRIEGEAEWVSVPEAKRNEWQHLAAYSHGILTPGNFFSLLGLLSVAYGLYAILAAQEYGFGAAVLLLGRLCDLLDGWLADKTHTKSPLGEKIDASFDKISIGATVVALALGHVVSWFIVALLLLPHLCTAVVALLAFVRRIRLHPSLVGKISMALGWLCILAFTVFKEYRLTATDLVSVIVFAMVAYSLLFISFGMGVWASVEYIGEYQYVRNKKA